MFFSLITARRYNLLWIIVSLALLCLGSICYNGSFKADPMDVNLIRYYADSARNWIPCTISSQRNIPVLVRSVAWLDTRLAIKDTPCLRIHILYPHPQNSIAFIDENTDIVGLLWSPSQRAPFVLDAFEFYSLHSGKKFFVSGVQYEEALITFHLDSNYKDAHLMSFTILNCEIPVNAIQVLTPPAATETHDFGVCVKPLYRHRNDSYIPLFIEWIETLLMFGVTQFHIYNCSLTLSPGMQRVFNHYINSGILVVQQFPTPFVREELDTQNGYTCVGPQHKAALSDCLYRNMNKFRYIIPLDPDEIIVPNLDDTYNTLMNRLVRHNSSVAKSSTISFYMKFFYQKEARHINKAESLLSLRYMSYLRSDQFKSSSQSYLSKSFVNPERCIVMYSHGCVYSYHPRF